jgi:hypothetical protein
MRWNQPPDSSAPISPDLVLRPKKRDETLLFAHFDKNGPRIFHVFGFWLFTAPIKLETGRYGAFPGALACDELAGAADSHNCRAGLREWDGIEARKCRAAKHLLGERKVNI